METQKKRRGDRRDGRLLRELDSLHFITGIIPTNRRDNEAHISVQVDLTAMTANLARKNETETDFPYTMFHLVVAALLKTITLRPKLNRFIVNSNFYQRNEVSAAFVVKKQFSDKGAEALAFLHGKDEFTVEDVHEYIRSQVQECRSEKVDSSTENMDILNKLPRWLGKAAVKFIMWLDKHGWVPKDMVATDPYYSSVVISNLGSIKLKCGYHHLTNWGTCSLFCIIGEKKKSPFFDESGQVSMRETLELGLTIDERIADGYYYSKSVRLLEYLLTHPEELERPTAEAVRYERSKDPVEGLHGRCAHAPGLFPGQYVRGRGAHGGAVSQQHRLRLHGQVHHI